MYDATFCSGTRFFTAGLDDCGSYVYESDKDGFRKSNLYALEFYSGRAEQGRKLLDLGRARWTGSEMVTSYHDVPVEIPVGVLAAARRHFAEVKRRHG